MGKFKEYRKAKTAKKAAVPAGVGILTIILMAMCRKYDIDIDEKTISGIALGGLALWEAFKNWRKNHKK
ncbi:MAG TPA: hypothetical protein VMY59_06410 [Candidatus Thermoplasmatota archaeon]|nr:hypothetical protein [Candidatus Thermoplasmatota archaeon]